MTAASLYSPRRSTMAAPISSLNRSNQRSTTSSLSQRTQLKYQNMSHDHQHHFMNTALITNLEQKLQRAKKRQKITLLLFFLIIKYWEYPEVKNRSQIWISWFQKYISSSTCLLSSKLQSSYPTIYNALTNLSDCGNFFLTNCFKKWNILMDASPTLAWTVSFLQKIFVLPKKSWNAITYKKIFNNDTTSMEKKTSIILLDDSNNINGHRNTIQSILLFWFAHAPNESQRKLWMVSASSCRKTILEVDKKVTEQFESIVYQLSTESSPLRREWLREDLYGWEGKLAIIIALDQMSRHIFRFYQSLNDDKQLQNKESTIHQNYYPLLSAHDLTQIDLDRIAMQVATLFTKKHESQIQAGTIPLQMYVFALMPYRHANTLQTYMHVQKCIEESEKIQIQMDATLLRFRKATSRRLNVLQDDARRQGKGSNTEEQQKNEKKTKLNPLSSTEEATAISDDHILEFFPFEADMSKAEDHIAVQTIEKFLQDKDIYPIYNTSESSHDEVKHQRSSRQFNEKSSFNTHSHQKVGDPNIRIPIIISLSGGVDSMVIAAICSHLATKRPYNNTKSKKKHVQPNSSKNSTFQYYNIQVIAVHINYANRPEAHAEAAYVQRFCESHNIDYRCREITEVTRGVTSRDEYEKFSRLVRYDFYKLIMKEIYEKNKKSNVSNSNGAKHNEKDLFVSEEMNYSNTPVLLGHHKGDVRENVLSNSMKGCGPLELSGMTEVGTCEGVTIWRPLLSLEKEDIFHYAHKFGIPYFKDTTPSWSTRGKLRNSLLPLLKEIYGEGAVRNLSFLANESDAARKLLTDTTFKPFFQSVQYFGPMGIIFDTHPWKTEGLFFWKFVLKDLLHSIGRGMFSDKSVMSFLERIQMKEVKPGWLQCRKDYAVYLEQNGKVCVFHPESFPWAQKDKYKIDGICVSVDASEDLHIGPWNITIERISNLKKKEADTLLGKKAIQNMERFMQGSFSYYLSSPRSLSNQDNNTESILSIEPEFTRQSRPEAWKGVDLKIQNTLPLVGNSQASLDALAIDASFNKTQIIKVSFQRDGVLDSKSIIKGDRNKNIEYNSSSSNDGEYSLLKKDVQEISSKSDLDDKEKDKLAFFWDDLIQPFVAQKRSNSKNKK